MTVQSLAWGRGIPRQKAILSTILWSWLS